MLCLSCERIFGMVCTSVVRFERESVLRAHEPTGGGCHEDGSGGSHFYGALLPLVCTHGHEWVLGTDSFVLIVGAHDHACLLR